MILEVLGFLGIAVRQRDRSAARRHSLNALAKDGLVSTAEI